MTSERCYECEGELIVTCLKCNPRAVPDVAELVRYSAIELVRSIDAGYDPFPSDDGDYVEFSQAAAIIAAKDKEIGKWKRVANYETDVAQSEIDGRKAAEAKLAQYETQEPVAEVDSGNPQYIKWLGNFDFIEDGTKLYTSPAPAADLKATNELINAAIDDYNRENEKNEKLMEALKNIADLQGTWQVIALEATEIATEALKENQP